MNLFNEQEEPVESDSTYGVSLDDSLDNQKVSESSSFERLEEVRYFRILCTNFDISICFYRKENKSLVTIEAKYFFIDEYIN